MIDLIKAEKYLKGSQVGFIMFFPTMAFVYLFVVGCAMGPMDSRNTLSCEIIYKLPYVLIILFFAVSVFLMCFSYIVSRSRKLASSDYVFLFLTILMIAFFIALFTGSLS